MKRTKATTVTVAIAATHGTSTSSSGCTTMPGTVCETSAAGLHLVIVAGCDPSALGFSGPSRAGEAADRPADET